MIYRVNTLHIVSTLIHGIPRIIAKSHRVTPQYVRNTIPYPANREESKDARPDAVYMYGQHLWRRLHIETTPDLKIASSD